jgi:hypothetical protein
MSFERELAQCDKAFSWTLKDLRWITVNTVKRTLAHLEKRLTMVSNHAV